MTAVLSTLIKGEKITAGMDSILSVAAVPVDGSASTSARGQAACDGGERSGGEGGGVAVGPSQAQEVNIDCPILEGTKNAGDSHGGGAISGDNGSHGRGGTGKRGGEHDGGRGNSTGLGDSAVV
ncbi:hypothetical protein PC121_g10097 [Phytophthora cactorum]|nr:hypothetical protein PC120_g11156 [Phytophthora cactorum]KAG3068683.1 hypothetical protein PC121_g10097 [Phytophthora cactorum]